MRRLFVSFAVSSLAALSACSSSNDRPDSTVAPPVDTGIVDTPDGGVVETDTGIVEDPDGGTNEDAEVGMDAEMRDPTCPQNAQWISSVRGVIVDPQGNPSVASKAQMCIRTAPSDSPRP